MSQEYIQLRYEEKSQYMPASCMSKREFYAGLAMQGILTRVSESEDVYHKKCVVIHACEYADALIKELEKNDGQSN